MRISATTAEQFRRLYYDPEVTAEQLIDSLSKPFVRTKYMEYGAAFHEAIENYRDDVFTEYVVINGIHFRKADIDRFYSYLPVGAKTFEVKSTKDYYVNDSRLTLVSKVDMLHGNCIYENKTNWTWYKYDNYANSIQWKLYLDCFQADKVIYTVGLFTDKKGMPELKEVVEPFEFIPYITMEDDIKEVLTDLYDFIILNNLQKLFKDK